MNGPTSFKFLIGIVSFCLISNISAANVTSNNNSQICSSLFNLPQWGPQATVGGLYGFAHNSGRDDVADKVIFGNFLVPLKQNSDSMWYIDGRQLVGSDCCFYTTNLGTGYRKIINNSYILGGYGFVDYTRSQNNNNFYQAQVGGEYLSPTWQARINGYVPVGDRTQSTNLSPPIGNGEQPIIFPGTVALVEYPFLEHAEAGGDIQIGSALPVNPSLFPFVGYYHFGFDQNLDTSINGGRAGIQYTYNRWLNIFVADQYDHLSKNLAIIGADVTLSGTNPSWNPSSVVDSLMEQTPFGYSGMF